MSQCPKKRLNQVYSLIVLSLSVWSIAHFYLFNASSLAEANFWHNIATVGAVFSAIFMFHFSLVFTKIKISKMKGLFLFIIYVIGGLFAFAEFNTNLLTQEMMPSYWGFKETSGPGYIFLSLFLIILVLSSIIICYRFYLKESEQRIKRQTELIIFGFAIPLIGGIITQVFFPLLNIDFLPLTSSLSTLTVIIIGFSIMRYKLMTPRSFSIQKKIVIMFFVFFFILLFFTLTLVNVVSTSSMEETINTDLQAIAQSRAQHIETYLVEQKKVTENTAVIEMIDRLLLLDRNDSDYNKRVNDTIDKLQRTVNIDNDIIHISVLDLSGEIIASTNWEIIGENKKHSPLFTNAKNETFVKDVHYPCKGGDKPVFGISTPVKYEENQTIGIVLIRFSIDKLYEITTDTNSLRNTGDIYLVNRTGFVISPLRFYNITYNYENVILKQKIDTINFHNAILHATHSDEELEKKHFEVTLFEDYRGISVFGTHVYFPEMKWVLCCEVDESEAMASVYQMQTRLTIFLSIFSVILLVFAWYYAKNLSEPIKKLDNYAKEITNGDLDVRAEINSSDEIGNLADSFNLMTKSLKDYTDNLETQVTERTKDLQGKIDELQRFKKVTVGRELKMVELKNEIKHLKGKTNLEDQP